MGESNGLGHLCICSENKCNSSPPHSTSFSALFVLLIFSLLWWGHPRISWSLESWILSLKSLKETVYTIIWDFAWHTVIHRPLPYYCSRPGTFVLNAGSKLLSLLQLLYRAISTTVYISQTDWWPFPKRVISLTNPRWYNSSNLCWNMARFGDVSFIIKY